MAGLGNGQRQAQHLLGHLFHLPQGGRGFDVPALASAAGVALVPDHKGAFVQGFGHLPGL